MTQNAERVAAQLNERGWAKFNTITDDGAVCLNGAQLAAGLTGDERERFCVHACQAITELFPERVFPEAWYRQQYFNDHPHTTRADVDLVLARVAELEAA
jgi:hypothetical protein